MGLIRRMVCLRMARRTEWWALLITKLFCEQKPEV